MALLRRVAAQELPAVLIFDADIEAACALVHSGRVEATMQVVFLPDEWPQPGVVVRRITELGWITLKAFGRC